jgi:hypothetical protein
MPNARNKHRNDVHLVTGEKKMRTLKFKIDDYTPKKKTSTSVVVSIAPVTPPRAVKREEKEEEDKVN